MQNKVKNFNEEKDCHFKPMSPEARLLDIMSEIGELGKEILKNTKYGTSDFTLTDDFVMEYGDVLYSMLSLANELNINSDNSLELVLNKYQERINKNNNLSSGN